MDRIEGLYEKAKYQYLGKFHFLPGGGGSRKFFKLNRGISCLTKYLVSF